MEGSDADASAVAGPAAAIGHGNGPGVPLPANMPEKWCGLVGAILALAEAWCGTDGGGPEYDASSTADIMRAFALQNSGTPEERRRLWKRNGRICVEHGLIFPMGFFACRDGHVALLGRSRRDWRRIAAALGDPEWARRPGFDNPFALARDSAEPDALLEETLADWTRDDLLARGLEEGAVVAPGLQLRRGAGSRRVPAGFREAGHAVSGGAPGQWGGCWQAETGRPRRTAGRACLRAGSSSAGPLVGPPMVGQMLADLGADNPSSRSSLDRTLRPLRARGSGSSTAGGTMDEHVRLESSLYFHSLNRNKTGLSLNLKS